jgi:hypothetical protein
MGYYPYRRRNWYPPKTSQRTQLTRDVAGIDGEVLQHLYTLDSRSLVVLFRGYHDRFGASPAKYALENFNQWKSGNKAPSAQTVARFLKLVPPLLTFDQKFALLKTIYDRTRSKEKHSMEVILGHSEGVIVQLNELSKRLCLKPSLHTLSPRAQSVLEWASDNDAQIARRLMVALETQESIAISAASEAELKTLLRAIREMNQSTVGTHQIELPYGTITVTVRHPSFLEKLGKFFS